MDHDTYSANDAIGKVNISLNPLLLPNLDASIQPDQSGKGKLCIEKWNKMYLFIKKTTTNKQTNFEFLSFRFCYVRLDTSI